MTIPMSITARITHLLMSDPLSLTSCRVIPPLSNSDHLRIEAQIKLKCSSKSPQSSSRPVWLYAHANWDKAREMIEECDWIDIMSDDTNDSWTRWHSSFMSIMQECVPRKILPSRRNLPWLNKNIKTAMRKRNTLFKKTGYSAKYRSARITDTINVITVYACTWQRSSKPLRPPKLIG